jgi:EAL domain-containing protein (putative c-di-GMP-specific phosphodiesterase class I)
VPRHGLLPGDHRERDHGRAAARRHRCCNALSSAGYKLSIDDFGTGYSSLAYLKRLPVDELKIDKSFVMAMENDADDAKIVRSTIDLAHNLGLSVVAEGVENAHVQQQLTQLGCDEGQGYHLCRPMPAERAARLCTPLAAAARGKARLGRTDLNKRRQSMATYNDNKGRP